jgi:hypothetical protein
LFDLDTLWLFNIAMENGPFIDVFLIRLLEIVIFQSYVKQPDGNNLNIILNNGCSYN